MSLLIPELERQLREVVRARALSQVAPAARRRPGARVLLVAAALPALAIAVIAVALLGHRAKPSASAGSRSPRPGLSGQSHKAPCGRYPGAVSMDTPTSAVFPEASHMILSGTIGRSSWTVLARTGESGFRAIRAGRLALDNRKYGMCGPGADTIAFELIDKPGHGIVYGYAAGHGPFTIRLRGPGVPSNGAGTISRVVPFPGGGGEFFIGSLPEAACSYRSLTLDVTAGAVHSSRTINLGACRPNQPVQLAGSRSTATGPGPSKLLATISLRPPSGTGGASGTFREISRSGAREIKIAASRLKPNTKHNAYAVWLYESPSKARLLGFVNPGVRRNGHLKTAGVLPKGGSAYREILITLETRPNPHTPGLVVLAGMGRIR